MTLLAIAAAVSLALVLGALWALYGRLGDRAEGFVLAAGGGALMFSAVLELIVPAQESISLTATGLTLMIGAGTFALIDYLIDKRWGDEGGVGFLAAATLDGVPENLALGVALIGAGFWDIAGLAGAIFLSNVPEGASGAKGMRAIGWPRGRILAIWLGTALFLVVAAVAGNLLFRNAPQEYLVLMQVFAGGAIIAALATEIFPKAYRRDHQMAGIATALGLLAALVLLHTVVD